MRSACETPFFTTTTRQRRSIKVSSKRRSPVSLMLRPPWMDSVNAAASTWSLWSATTFFWWFAVVVWIWSKIFGRASAIGAGIVGARRSDHVHRDEPLWLYTNVRHVVLPCVVSCFGVVSFKHSPVNYSSPSGNVYQSSRYILYTFHRSPRSLITPFMEQI
jgi:hypothetical protein